MTKFLDLFEPIQKGDFGLTDEAIYKSIQSGKPFIPIWGGNKDHSIQDRLVSINGKTKAGNKITIFEGEGIIISLDGSSGSMTYKKDKKFALNHHAGFFKVRSDAINKINLKFFVHFFDTQLKNESISEGSKTLTLDQIYNLDFDIPDFSIQQQIMTEIKPILEKKRLVEEALQQIEKIKDKFFSDDYTDFQAMAIPVKEIIDCMSGNTGLTEQFIYQKIQHSGKKYDVLGSSQEHKIIGEIPKCEINGKPIKFFEDKEGLFVIRKGKAGHTRILIKGNYTINEDAYILSVKDDCQYKINLKWLSIQYKEDFLSYSSSADNGTWNMTGFFNNVLIDIPEYNEQMEVVNEYTYLEDYESKLKEIQNKIESIFTKNIA